MLYISFISFFIPYSMYTSLNICLWDYINLYMFKLTCYNTLFWLLILLSGHFLLELINVFITSVWPNMSYRPLTFYQFSISISKSCSSDLCQLWVIIPRACSLLCNSQTRLRMRCYFLYNTICISTLSYAHKCDDSVKLTFVFATQQAR